MKKKRINTVNNVVRRTRSVHHAQSSDMPSVALQIGATSVKKSERKTSQGITRRRKRIQPRPTTLQQPVTVPDAHNHQVPKPVSQKPKKNYTKVFFEKIGLFLKKQWFWFRYVVKATLVVFGIVLFFNAREKTVVTIRPHYEYVDIDQDVTAYLNPDSNQIGFDIMAITDEVSIPVIANDTREVQKRASGLITIYNNYSTEPQRLLPETRFESAGGKIFTLGNSSVIIPGKTDIGPGSIEVEVYAAQAGDEYNLDITDFTIPGFQELGLTAKYNALYAVSSKPFEGGFIGSEPYVSKQQRAEAEELLIEKLQERLQERLDKEKSNLLTLVSGSTRLKTEDTTYIFDADEGIDIATKQGTIFAIVMDSVEIAKYVVADNYDTSRIENTSVVDEIQVTQRNTIFNVDTDDTLNIRLLGTLLLEFDVDEPNLKDQLRGRSLSEVPFIFESIDSVDRAQVKVYPFWKKNISRSDSEVSIRYEE